MAGKFKGWDCGECETVAKLNPANGEAMKRQRGCYEPTPRPLFDDVPGFGPLSRCPVSELTDLSRGMMRLYLHYEAGHLGPIMDLPAPMVDAMEALTQTIRSAEKERADG